MATTNFAALQDEQYAVWARQTWHEERNRSFINSFVGDGPSSMIQRITELKTTPKGNRCIITLVNDADGDGVVGDNQLKGNEATIGLDQNEIRFDQLRFGHANTGRMADQKSVVSFRKEAQDQLANKKAQAADELAFLTMSGVSYSFKPDGTARVGSQWPMLEYAADVTAPTAARHRRWDKNTGLEPGSTTDVATEDVPTWAMLVEAKAYAVNTYLKPLRYNGGIEVFNVFMTPTGIARLKQDQAFLDAWKNAGVRGESNAIFKGTPHGGRVGILVDGLNILEYRNVYHPSNWGGGSVNGQRILFCGAQAMAYADPNLFPTTWEEERDDYNNRYGIASGSTYGFKKPTFFNTHTQSVEDFGVLCIDTAV